MTEEALAQGTPLYCYHELVHNRLVTDGLRERGVQFVDSLAEVPAGARVIFPAHGVPPSIWTDAKARDLQVINATCPFVEKVHREVLTYADEGRTILYIGHRGHDEVIGVAGEAPKQILIIENAEEAATVQVPDPSRVAYVTQTTLGANVVREAIEVLHKRFPLIARQDAGDLCYATQERQDAVTRSAAEADGVIVLGSPNSSNSRRLAECARAAGTEAVLIGTLEELKALDLQGWQRVGLTSGASTPESFFEAARQWLEQTS